MHAALARAVGDMPGVGGETLDRADIDDATAVAQHRQQRFGEKYRCGQVDRQHSAPVVELQCVEIGLEHETGVVDQDIDALPALSGGIGDRRVALRLREIGFDPAAVFEFPRKRFALRYEDIGPGLAQRPADAEPDPLAAAGNHGGFAIEAAHQPHTGLAPLTSTVSPQT